MMSHRRMNLIMFPKKSAAYDLDHVFILLIYFLISYPSFTHFLLVYYL